MWAASADPAPAVSARTTTISSRDATPPSGSTVKARPQCLRPHPRGVRGEVQGTDRGDESRDRGSAAADGFGRGRWAAVGGEGGQTDEERINRKPFADVRMNFLYLQRIYWKWKLSNANFEMFGKADLSTCLAAVIRPRNR